MGFSRSSRPTSRELYYYFFFISRLVFIDFAYCLCSVFRFRGTAKVRGPLHADGVRLPDAGPRAQAGRPRGPVQVRVRRPAGLAEHRGAGQQSRRAESGPHQAGVGHLDVRPDLVDGQGQR